MKCALTHRRGALLSTAGAVFFGGAVLAQFGFAAIRLQTDTIASGFLLFGVVSLPRGNWFVRWLGPIGVISYGMYLWHWTLLRSLVLTGTRVVTSVTVATVVASSLELIALTALVSIPSYVAIERPALRWAEAHSRSSTARLTQLMQRSL